ncbi:unnamed protein product, partial [marine sediment metagenome]
KIIFAAPSVKNFVGIRKKLKSSKVKDVIYWPVLKKSEGYYISAFSRSSGLNRVFNEILSNKIPTMLDLEIPLKRGILKHLHYFFKSKRLIDNFLLNAEKNGIEIYTAEYDIPHKLAEALFSFIRLTLNPKKFKHQRIVMLYTSFRKNQVIEDYLLKQLEKSKQKYGEDFLVGLGVIAPGVGENEPILSPSHLEHDLKVLNREGIKKVVIFRLGGLNKKYLEVIKKYVS